jgi:AcrR family transcriptional regulator
MVLDTDTVHLRADAQRNLERILEAARALLAERGLETSVADVAERAGVGTATIFRRFPTKEDLVAEVVERELRATLEQLQAAADADDPMTALEAFVTKGVEFLINDRCLCDVTGTTLLERPRLEAAVAELNAALDVLVCRAQKAGAIRKDVGAADLGFLIGAIGRAGLPLEEAAPGAWRRYVEIVLDGLRPEGARRLKHRAPTPQQVHEAKRQ